MSGIIRITCGLLLLLTLSNCRKGEGDPKFSFESRKNRLCGSWKMSSASASLVYNYKKLKPYTERYSMTSSKLNGTEPYSFAISINKDGTFALREERAKGNLVAKGTWDFNKGVGDQKSKTNVIFSITEVEEGYTSSYFVFNQFSTYFIHTLKALGENEIIMTGQSKLYSEPSTFEVQIVTEYKLVQE